MPVFLAFLFCMNLTTINLLKVSRMTFTWHILARFKGRKFHKEQSEWKGELFKFHPPHSRIHGRHLLLGEFRPPGEYTWGGKDKGL